uniref:5-HT1A n=1 Tax=Sinonovacula constricta TaxID=98310 RepID=A0AA95Z9G6_SINCO|nr:5-HT1A [Sinonovacula constricta]
MESTSLAPDDVNQSDVMPTGVTRIDGPQIYSVEHLVGTTIVLGLMILCTIIGNVFVIAAILLEKNLHNVANYLILSLAVADLMVASIVMPISAVKEISQVWFLQAEVCDMWVCFDVLCCTSSILHLVAISIDRYWAVTNIDYIRNRTAKRILIMIALVWIFAMCISIPPLFGWKDENDPTVTGVCIISQDHGYTLFSTIGAFYLPTILMLVIYAKIYSVARKRIRRKRFNELKQKNGKETRITEMTMLSPQSQDLSGRRTDVSESPCNGNGDSGSGDHDDNENKFSKKNGHVDDAEAVMLPNNEIAKAKRQKEKLEMKRERKAARTLAIITGSFISCWLPFFIMAITAPFIREYVHIPPLVESITLWLGYCNSMLNPIIYTVFNPEFRKAFQKILFGKYSRKYRRR